MFNLFKRKEEDYRPITFHLYRVNGKWDTKNVHAVPTGVKFSLHDTTLDQGYPDSIYSTGEVYNPVDKQLGGSTIIALYIDTIPFDIHGNKYFSIKKSSQKLLRDKLRELRAINSRELEREAIADLGAV
jgi:hypothetical protein